MLIFLRVHDIENVCVSSDFGYKDPHKRVSCYCNVLCF